MEIVREADSAGLSASLADGQSAAPGLSALEEEQIGLETFALGQPSLDEVFLALTGQPTEGQAEENEEIPA